MCMLCVEQNIKNLNIITLDKNTRELVESTEDIEKKIHIIEKYFDLVSRINKENERIKSDED